MTKPIDDGGAARRFRHTAEQYDTAASVLQEMHAILLNAQACQVLWERLTGSYSDGIEYAAKYSTIFKELAHEIGDAHERKESRDE